MGLGARRRQSADGSDQDVQPLLGGQAGHAQDRQRPLVRSRGAVAVTGQVGPTMHDAQLGPVG